MSPWKTFELITGQSALPYMWRSLLGDSFLPLRNLCLQPAPEPGGLLPCPNDCGCDHLIILRHDRTAAIAICRCFPPDCPDIEMTIEEATPLRLDAPKLGRALARALACQPTQANIGPFNTLQIGSWSSAAVPVFLTLQTESRDLQFTAAHLAATLADKFILLTPTKDLLTAETAQLLATSGAALFDLASTITLTPNGTLHPIRVPGDLFQQFNPEIKDLDQSVAERAFALIQQLDSDLKPRPPSAITVFRLYCIEELTAQQIADKCRCSKTTVLTRLADIRHKTGLDPKDLRRQSQHLATNSQLTRSPHP